MAYWLPLAPSVRRAPAAASDVAILGWITNSRSGVASRAGNHHTKFAQFGQTICVIGHDEAGKKRRSGIVGAANDVRNVIAPQ